MLKNILIILPFLFSMNGAFAAVAKKVAVKRPPSILIGAGSIKGGKSGNGFSLLNVQTKLSKSKRVERMSFDVGNSAMGKLNGPVAYFNVQNDPKNKKLIIDFSQTLNSKFEERNLQKVFAKSPFVQKSELLFEPQSQTMSLILSMKKETGVHVRPVSGTPKKTAYLIVDIFEPSFVRKVSAERAARKTIKR